jgi:hypothetical protein
MLPQLDRAPSGNDSRSGAGAGWRGSSPSHSRPVLFDHPRGGGPGNKHASELRLSLSDIGERTAPNYFLTFPGTASENTVQSGCSYPRIRVQIGYEYGSFAGVA